MLSTIKKRMSSFTGANFGYPAVHPMISEIAGPPIQEFQEVPPFDVRSLQELLRKASDVEIVTTARLLVGYMSDSGMEEIMKLSSNGLFEIMSILQKAIDARVPDYTFFLRCLKQLVMRKGILPPYLLLSGVRRLDRDPIAGGGFADVWRGELRGEVVALKVLRDFDWASRADTAERAPKELCKEALIWRQLKDRNVLPFYGVCVDEFYPRYALISPWMNNGSMVTFLRNHPDVDRPPLIARITLGLRYLHLLDPPIVHGDLRGANVLIDDEGEPRLADFGLSRAMDSQTTLYSSFKGKGQIRWQAPELLNISRLPGIIDEPSTMSDIYALACVYLEAFTGEPPFADIRQDGAIVMEIAIHDKRPRRPDASATRRGLNDRLWTLMQDCWVTHPSKRPKITDIPGRLLAAYSPTENPHLVSESRKGKLKIKLPPRWSSYIETPKILQQALKMDSPASVTSSLDQTLYQRCSQVRMRLLQVPGFDAYLSIIASSQDPQTLDDPITELWNCFALGAPLCFLYNLLPRVEPIIRINIDPESIDPSDTKAIKEAIAHFVMAFGKTDLADENGRLFVTDLLNRSLPDGFLTVLDWVTRILDRLVEQLQRFVAQDGLTDEQENNEQADIVLDFIESEFRYVEDLNMIQEFVQSAASSGKLSPADAHMIFPNLVKIIQFHTHLLDRFQDCYGAAWAEQRWDLCFSDHEEEFVIYELYYANLDQAFTFARKARRTSNPECLSSEHVLFNLEEYMKKPISRIYEYIRFLVMLTWTRSYSQHLFSAELFAGLQLLMRTFKHVQLTNSARRLESQITDWLGYSPDAFGRLLCDDIFSVELYSSEIRVFLFQYAILLCSSASEHASFTARLSKSSDAPLHIVQCIFMNSLQAVFRSCDEQMYFLHIRYTVEENLQDILFRCDSQAKHLQWWIELNRLTGHVRPSTEHDSIFIYS